MIIRTQTIQKIRLDKSPKKYIDYQRDTEFSRLIDGKEAYPVWEVMDELMQILKMIMPPLYSGTMQKIRAKTQ